MERLSSDPLDPVFIRAYALSLLFVSRTLLEALKPKLSSAEREYVDDFGPKIVQERLSWCLCSSDSIGTTPEGKDARREAERLETLAAKKLTAAGVSADRQTLLRDLVFGASADFCNLFPPRKIEDIRFHAKQELSEGKLTRFKELAELMSVPREIRDYLSLLLDAALRMAKIEAKAV